MERQSHNGALAVGLLLGAAGGAAWALWNAQQSGEELRAKAFAFMDATLGWPGESQPLPKKQIIVSTEPFIAGDAGDIVIDGPQPLDRPSFSSQGDA